MSGLVTCDIFDTLLTRRVGDPQAVFTQLERQLRARVGHVDFLAFAQSRVAAEALSRQGQPNHETTLQRIYDVLKDAYQWSEAEAEAAMSAEIELERACLVPVPGALAMLAQQRQTATHVAYVSDMYLPSDVIQSLLQRHGFWHEGDALYVSGELGVSKATGSIWQKIINGAEPGTWTHLGDNAVADQQSASRAGAKTVLLSQNQLNRYESLMAAFRENQQLLPNRLAGAARLTRLNAQPVSHDQQGMVDSVTGVVAPVLVTFVLWVLEQSRQRGIKRLFFLSRDGQVMLAIAEALLRSQPHPMSLHYLCGNRKLWHLARTQSIDACFLNYLLEAPDGLTLQRVARRAAVDVAELQTRLSGTMATRAPEAMLSATDCADLRQQLTQPPLADWLLEHCNSLRARTLRYFVDTGLTQPQPAAVIDVGWTGKTLRCLHDLLEHQGGSEHLTTFYFGNLKRPPEAHGCRADSFLFDSNIGPNYLPPKLPEVVYTRFIENFCVSNQGRLLDYAEQSDGTIAPEFADGGNPAAEAWGLTDMRELIRDYCQILTETELPEEPVEGLRPMVDALLCEFYQRPSEAIARTWASFPVETDAASTYADAWARPYTLRDILHVLRRGYLDAPSIHWQEASEAITPRPIERTLKTTIVLRGWLSELKNQRHR